MAPGRYSGFALMRSALGLALVVGAILGFWAAVTNEQLELPGIAAQERVETFATSSRHDTVVSDLEALALAQGGEVFVEIATPVGRTVYGAGSRAEGWMEKGYQGLPGTPDIVVRPLSELPHGDYRQIFELAGSANFLNSFRNYLDEQGISHRTLVGQQWQYLLFGTALGSIFQLLIGFCFALCVIGVIVNARSDAVRQLHGIGLFESAWCELRRAGQRTVAPIGVVSLAVLAATAWWTNPYSALQWLRFQAVFTGVALAVCALSVIATLWLLRRTSVVALLSGRLPGKLVLVGVYLVRLGALIAVASMSIGALNYSFEWSKQRAEADSWESLPQSYYLELSGARSLEDIAETTQVLANRLREFSAQGRLYLVRTMDPGSLVGGHLDRDVVVYNEAAAEVSLEGAALAAYRSVGKLNEPVWLQPDDLSPAVSLEMIQQATGIQQPGREVVYPAGSSQAHTWQVGTDEWINRAWSPDPLLVVVPNDALFLSDRNIVAAVTQKSAVLARYEDFRALQADSTVGSFIRMARPMSQQWAIHHQRMARTAWLYIGALVASLALTIVTSCAVLFASLRIFHQKLRAHFVQGTIPITVVYLLCAFEALVIAGVLSYLWNRGAPVRQWGAGGTLAGAADPSLIAMFTVPTAVWWLVIVLALCTSVPAVALWARRYSISQLIHTRR